MALLAEKTVSGCGLGCLRIESLKPARMLGSTAYGSKLPLSKLIIKSCLVRVSCNISSTSWISEGMKETLGCGIMMQSVRMPSQDAMHIKKHKPVMDVAGGDGPDLIVDDATLLIHLGVKAEEEFSNTGKLPDPETTTNLEFQMVLGLIKESIKVDPLRYHRMKERLVGVSGETTTAVKRQMQDSGSLPFPAINVNGPSTRIKFDNLYGSRPSLPDGLMEATDFMMGGTVVRCGYGDVGKPFCAVQNLMEALPEGVYGDVGKLIMEAMGGTVVRCGYGDVGKPFCAVQNLTEALPEGVYGDVGKLIMEAMGGTVVRCGYGDVGKPFCAVQNLTEALPEGVYGDVGMLMEATDFMMGGTVVRCGYGDVGKPFCAVQNLTEALPEGVYGDVGKPFCAVQNLTEALPEGVFHTADIFVTTTSNKYIIMVDHKRKMKNNAIVCNIGLGEGPLMNLGCAYTGHPSFVMSCSFTRRQRISTCSLRDLTILKRTDSCHKDEGPSLASSTVLFQC